MRRCVVGKVFPFGELQNQLTRLNNLMPQLLPYFFLNQITFVFVVLLVLVYILSKYVLPLFTLLQVARLYITKLSNKN
jgi:F-type H+-transporting ATPase subunit 8